MDTESVNGRSVIFINGINNTLEDATRSAQLLAEHTGDPVELVYNPRFTPPIEDALPLAPRLLLSPIIDSTKGFASIISHKFGTVLESDTVIRLGRAIKSAYECGREIVVHAHSQGALILRDTLEVLRNTFLSRGEAERWNDLVDHLTIYTYGIDVDNWVDVEPLEEVNQYDPVYLATTGINNSIDFIGQRDEEEAEEARETNKNTAWHSFTDYIEDE